MILCKNCKFFIMQHPFNSQNCSKHFTHYNRRPSWLLKESPSHAAINAQRLFLHKYQPLSTVRYNHLYRWWTWAMSNEKTCPLFTMAYHRIWTQALLVDSPKLYIMCHIHIATDIYEGDDQCTI